MKTTYILAICAAMAAFSTSCDHKDLCFNHPHSGRLNVVFDWTNAPDANPESMSLYLYPKNGGVAQRYEFVGKTGGTIEVSAGEYTLVCINSDTRKIVLNQPNNTTYSDGDLSKYFEISTVDASLAAQLKSISSSMAASAPRARGSEDERVAYPPEAFWTDTKSDVVVENISVSESQTITLYPSPGYCTYTVRLQNIANAANVYELSASLSGMAGGLYVAQRLASDDVVTFPFEVNIDRDNATAEGTFFNFGHCPPGTTHEHYVVIYAVMNSGQVYSQTVDVTDQVHNATDPYNVVISINEVPLPDEVTSGSGGSITVEKWETIQVPIQL